MAWRKLALATVLISAGAAHAQTAGTVNLRANQTSATGSMSPVLTWSTSPVATSCTASGGWSGTKATSGTQTLSSITTSRTYTLTCTWGSSGTANVQWVAPSANTNGSQLTDLAGFKVVYGTSSTALTRTQMVNDVTARAATVRSLGSGTWYFAVRAVNSSSGESGNSNVGQKVVSSANASASRNVAITINPATQTLRVYNATVYDVSRTSAGPYALGRVVGTVPVGRSCQAGYSVPGTDYYRVWREEVTFSRTSRSNVVMARCRRS